MWECGNGDVEGESQIVFNTDRTNTYKKTVKDMFGTVKVILLYSFIRDDPKYDFHG